MEAAFQPTKDKIIEYVQNFDGDSSLLGLEMENQLVNQNQISPPILDLKKMDVSTEMVVPNLDEIPEGVPFTPGRAMKVVHYQVPYSDHSRVFHQIVTSYIGANNVQKDSTKVYVKFFLASGTQAEEESVADQARKYFDAIQQKIQEFEELCNEFNQKGLRGFVAELLKERRAELKGKEDQEDRLNPYK
jgi:hypothetical protein